MALSNAQLLMLDNLIYTDYCENGKDVRGIIREMTNDLNNGKKIEGCMMTADEWRNLISSINDEPTLLNYTVQNYETNSSTGMRAACFVNDTDNPTDVNVVFRGTSGDYEWHDNGEGGYLSDTEQQKAAADYVNSLPDKFGNNMTVTGHSKGGNKAQYVTIVTDRIAKCVSYDGQGFSEEFINKYKETIAKKSQSIVSISASDDYVNCLLYPIAGTRVYIETEDQDNFLYYHKPNILLDDNGNIRKQTEQSDLSKFITEYTTYMIADNLSLLETEKECLSDKAETTRDTAEIRRLCDTNNYTEEQLLEKILSMAQTRYNSLQYTPVGISTEVGMAYEKATPQETFNSELFLRTVEQVILAEDGNITLKLKNNIII